MSNKPKNAKSRTQPQRKRPPQGAAARKQPEKRPFPVMWVGLGVLAVLFIAAIALTFDSGGGEFGEPDVAGAALPPFAGDSADDSAIGTTAPTVTGADFDGNPVSIEPNGKPQAILFASHWCGVCQEEIPEVRDWLNQGNLPDGVELRSVVTLTSSGRANYPPSAWLERENWTAPVLVDDSDSSVAAAFGITGVPAWVFTDGEGRVVLRSSGLTDLPVLTAFLNALAAGG
jgi:hypothetical protein